MKFLSQIVWTDPAVQSALIQSAGAIVAALVAAVAAMLIGRQFAKRKRLQSELLIAKTDIAFLLAVEERHCEMNRQQQQESFKTRVRKQVRATGLQWSGRFTPGRSGIERPALIASEL